MLTECDGIVASGHHAAKTQTVLRQWHFLGRGQCVLLQAGPTEMMGFLWSIFQFIFTCFLNKLNLLGKPADRRKTARKRRSSPSKQRTPATQ